jgi:hypothetical protein
MDDHGQWPNDIVCVLTDTGVCPALYLRACTCMKMSDRMYARIAAEKVNGKGAGVQSRTEKDCW